MSSSDIAISVRGLSKAYTVTHNQVKHNTLAEAMLHRVRHPFQRPRRETFWALQDVNFEVKKGEVVGIIGRNGAGKSTLLKILSRITDPTRGEIDLYGRVGSLLEVGTGFHQELTGRENIYLNGHILGMRRREIDRQFDAIVDFAGTEQFLDTPVKRYSSGMYVRLAFAVAAHLNPEILIVDEVLAVGDSAFQKKCLGKMSEVAHSGRTVLFVSHNMAATQNLCSRAIVLGRGKIAADGPAQQSIEFYNNWSEAGPDAPRKPAEFRPSWAKDYIRGARITDADGIERSCFPMGSDLRVEVDFDATGKLPIRAPVLGVILHHAHNGCVGGVNTRMSGLEAPPANYSTGTIACTLKRPPLLHGPYTADLWLGDGPGDIDCLAGYLKFEIESTDIYGTGRTPFQHMGMIYLEPQWSLEPGEPAPLAALPSKETAVFAPI